MCEDEKKQKLIVVEFGVPSGGGKCLEIYGTDLYAELLESSPDEVMIALLNDGWRFFQELLHRNGHPWRRFYEKF